MAMVNSSEVTMAKVDQVRSAWPLFVVWHGHGGPPHLQNDAMAA